MVQANEAEAIDIMDAYQAFEFQAPLTLVWRGQATGPNETSRRVRVQYKSASRFQPVQLAFQTLGINSPLPKPRQKVTTPVAPATEERRTIRITAPETYRQAFLSNSKQDNPRSILQDLQRWQLTHATKGQPTSGDWNRFFLRPARIPVTRVPESSQRICRRVFSSKWQPCPFWNYMGSRQQQPKVKWHKKPKD